MVPAVRNISRTTRLRSATILMLMDTRRPTADAPLVVATVPVATKHETALVLLR